MKTDRWGCPKWLDHAAYPTKPDDLEDWQWRWEFLRRTPEYREAWKRAEPNPGRVISENEDILWDLIRDERIKHHGFPCESDSETVEHIWHMGKMMLDPRTSLDSIGTESVFYHDNSVLFSLPTFEFIENYLAKNSFLLDFQVNVLLSFLKQTLMISKMERDRKVALAKFDLSMPLQPQLDQCESELNSTLRRHGKPMVNSIKNRHENWSRHLRVIDAVDQLAKSKPKLIWLEIMGRELPQNEFDKKVSDGKINVSQLGRNLIKEAREIMAKASLLP